MSAGRDALPNTDSGGSSLRFTTEQGHSAFYWIDGAYAFALAAPLERDHLMPIATKVYDVLEKR